MRNIEERIKRLIEWSKGNPQGPISIHLDPTNRCNLKCRFCWQRSHERLGWLDTENELSGRKLLSIVDQAAELGVKDWLISGGGEPLLRTDDTVSIMKAIKKNGMTGDIITNGTMLNSRHIKDIVNFGWDTYRVSINGPNAKEHDFLVNSDGAFDKAVKSIVEISRLKEEIGVKYPEIGFNTVINRNNYQKLPEIIELLHDLGGTFINTQTIILYSEEEKVWTLKDEHRKDSQEYIRKSIETAKKLGIRTNLESYLDKKLLKDSTEMDGMKDLTMSEVSKINHANGFVKTFCFEPFYLMTIRANGTVGSCRLFGDKGDNITEKSLRDIWFGEYFTNARESQINGNVPEFCTKCGSNEFLENKKIREELMRHL